MEDTSACEKPTKFSKFNTDELYNICPQIIYMYHTGKLEEN